MKERGMVLVTGLIFLIMLTILGTVALSNTVTTERMTQNMRDMSLAFGAAESSLSDGETWLKRQTTAPTPVTTCQSAPCAVWDNSALGTFYTQSDAWWTTNATGYSSAISGVVSQPRYIIEAYSFVPYELSPDAASKGQGYYYYRVTSRGLGATNSARAVVQSIYAVQYN